NAELFGNDFFDTCFDIAHGFPLGVVNEPAILAVSDLTPSSAGRREETASSVASNGGFWQGSARSRRSAYMYMPPLTCNSWPVT
ncbi:hypothetical protein, partial [Proteus mirabilis]|uniref:hypothetical protein n=1 Tax=Proteus mirabilis TaxID=584 RepID=UPI001C89EA13